ncbi:MAG TPA: hypothetical protein VFD41_10220 [Actinomycetales bacterium]|nr:hypothetical protein [Actinomycetales bacterium]
MEPVARLDRDAAGYRLRYLARALDVTDFRPLLGFPDLDGDYRSRSLFSLLAGRAMSPRRPDYRAYREALDLDTLAGPWDELAASQGSQMTDGLQLFGVPVHVHSEGWACPFLVHGIRHVQAGVTADVQDRIDRLRRGDRLGLISDPDNEHNPHAVLTTDGGGYALGWVPDFLLPHLRGLRRVREPSVTVAHTNPRDVAGHLRLRILLRGDGPDGYRPFAEVGFEPLGETAATA